MDEKNMVTINKYEVVEVELSAEHILAAAIALYADQSGQEIPESKLNYEVKATPPQNSTETPAAYSIEKVFVTIFKNATTEKIGPAVDKTPKLVKVLLNLETQSIFHSNKDGEWISILSMSGIQSLVKGMTLKVIHQDSGTKYYIFDSFITIINNYKCEINAYGVPDKNKMDSYL